MGVVHTFRRFPFLDPDLPDDLMIRNVPVYDGLNESAQRYFDSRVVNGTAAEPAKT